MEQKKLSFGTKIGFGIGDIGGNIMFTIMAFWIQPYLYETLGLMPALAGIAVWIAKIWDAFADPVMGYVSDRTRTRWGRRRPYLFIGGILAVVALGVMFFNPHFDKTGNQVGIFIWAIFAYCLLGTVWTLFNIPYSALTPDITDDYHQQTSLNGTRMFLALIGTFLAAGAFLQLVGLFSQGNSDKSQGYFITGIVYGLLVMVATLITFFSVREKPVAKEMNIQRAEIFKSYLRVLRNKPFRFILFAYAINLIGITIISSNMQLYFKYIFNNEGMTPIALFCLLGVALAFIPVWIPLIKRIGKNVAYAIGLFIIAAATIIVFFFASTFGMVFMFVVMGVAGIGLAATYVAPWTMIPDTIEYDQVQSGKREEGAYYGLWTFFSKTGQAMAGLLGGLILQVMNYIPITVSEIQTAVDSAAKTQSQAPEAILGIRLLLGPIPAVFLVLAGIIVLFYPITEKVYKEIMSKKKAQ